MTKKMLNSPFFPPGKMKMENQSLKRRDLLGWTEIPTVIEIEPQVEKFNCGKKKDDQEAGTTGHENFMIAVCIFSSSLISSICPSIIHTNLSTFNRLELVKETAAEISNIS
jgi:hypothetical protein